MQQIYSVFQICFRTYPERYIRQPNYLNPIYIFSLHSQKQRNYSLIWLLDKTKTAMGSRMLKNYIENPLIDKKEIEERYNIVETLLQEFILKSDLQEALFEVYDLDRLSGRVAFGNANARDLLQLKSSLKVLPQIHSILDEIHYHKNILVLDEL